MINPARLLAGAVLVAALSIPAIAQQTVPHPRLPVQDPYVGINNMARQPCCNGHDCRKALKAEDFEPLDHGAWRVIPTGEVVEYAKTAFSPDGFFHICRTGRWDGTRWLYDQGEIRCLMIPPGTS